MKFTKQVSPIIPSLISILSIFLFQSCSDSTEGNRIIVEESRNLSPFNRVEMSGSFDVILEQATTSNITLTAESNILALISTEVRGDTLEINFTEFVTTNQRVKLHIQSPDYRAIEVDGAADITSFEELDLEHLTLQLDGSGSVALTGNTVTQSIFIRGSSYVQHFNLQSEEVAIAILGSGNAEVTVYDQLSVDISSSGDIFYKGTPIITSDISGSGSVIDAN